MNLIFKKINYRKEEDLMRKLSLRIASMLLALVITLSLAITGAPLHSHAASEIVVTVGPTGCDYTTINDALDAIASMSRSSGQRAVIEIQPGNYEEMLRISLDNITLRNASPDPSLELTNKGVDIDANAVRITSYYGHGYNYYSMNSDYLWDADTLAANKASGSASTTNAGGTSSTHWNATVIISGDGFRAEGIIFENSFNQYVSAKAADDVIVDNGSAKEGDTARGDLPAGSTAVQDKAYVERAAALAIAKNVSQAYFENCKIIGRQDTLYGGKGATAAFYGCEVYGACDYIFGGMTAVFAKCDLVFNTSENKNDRGYITAPQQSSGRGYLFYNCTVTSTTPGVDTASSYRSKPGYWGRPWAADTGEAVFYNTIVEATDDYWVSSYGKSLIMPAGWLDTLKGESALCGEYGTYELSGVDNSGSRASWAQVFTSPSLSDGTAISVSSYLGSWDAFSGKDMTIVLPDGTEQPAETAAPTVPSDGTVPEGSYVHNFTSDGKVSSFYTITGNTATNKGSVTWGGLSLTTCLKMESSTNISFTAPEAGTLTLVFGGSTAASGKKVKVDGTSCTVSSDGTYTQAVAAGAHTITKGDSIFLFYMVYTPNSALHTCEYVQGETVAPTCTEDGYTLYSCACGNTEQRDLVAATGHSYADGVCTVCGAIDPNSSAHTHSYASVVTAPTCTAQGYTTYTCECGESYVSDYVDATGHSYADGVCGVCGAADPDYVAPTEPPVVTPASAEIHNFTENGTTSTFYSITGSTSTSKGSVTYNGLTLTTCLKMESKTNISFTAPSAGTLTLVFGGSTAPSGKAVKIDGTSYHVGSDGTLTVDVASGAHTVTKDDAIFLFYMVYTPESTGETHTHSYTSSITTAATCETAGVRTYVCDCGDSYTESIAALGHSYNSVVTDPTCTAGGYTTYTCATCGDSYQDNQTSATGHSAEAVPGKAATCTETGLTDGSVCSVCNEVLTAQEEIPALGHTAEAVPGKAATCTETGLTDGSVCSVCNEVLTAQEEIPALGHTAEAVPGKAATCTEAGLTDGSVCSVCGEVLTAQEEIPALGHNYTSSVNVPTCEEDGLRTYTCANCGDTYSEVIPATGHTAEAVPGKAATCTATGLSEGSICSVCQKVLVAQEEIPMAAHSYAGGACTVCGAKDPDYVAPDPSLKQGLQKGDDGNFYYYIDGVVQEDFTGLVDNAIGRWYIVNGMAQLNFDGVIEYRGTKYLIKAGCVNTAYTDLYRIEGGFWLYFVEGVQDTEFVGLVTRLGMQAYVEQGEVNFNKTAIIEHEGNLVFVKYGIFRDTFVGLYRDDAGQWLYFVNGVFDPSYTGVAALNSMWVYVENGYVNFSFSGTITVGAYDYTVKYGVVQL